MKKALLIGLFFLSTPFAVHASTQVLPFSMTPQSNTTQSWGTYITNASGIGRGASLPNISTITSVAGTISGLTATSSNLTTVGTWTVSFYKNGVQQTLTCTIGTSTGGCTDALHPFSVVAGDNLQVSIVPASSPNVNITIFGAVNFVPTTDNESMVPSGQDAAAPSTTVTNYIALATARAAWSTTEASSTGGGAQTIWPDAGTVSSLYYNNNATAAGAGKTIALTVMKNQVATALTATVDNAGAGKTNDTTHSFSVIQGDYLDLQSVPTGTPSTQTHGAGLKFVSTTNGNFPIFGGNWQHNAAAAFNSFAGDIGSSTDAGAANIVKSMTITGFTVLCAAAPGATRTDTFTLRVNGVDTAMVVSLTGATQRSNSTTGSITINNNDLVDYHFTATNSPTQTNCQMNAVANNSTVVVTIPHARVILNLGTWLINGGKVILY